MGATMAALGMRHELVPAPHMQRHFPMIRFDERFLFCTILTFVKEN